MGVREACHLLVEKMLADGVTVGVSLTGALTPAGLGISCLIPLIQWGFVDWIVSTGANLYHDIHFAIGLDLHRGNAATSDLILRQEGVVRIYDIFFDYEVLLSTDRFLREVIAAPEFQKEMSTAEFHYRVGKYLAEREQMLGVEERSLLAAAYRSQVPVYTSSPGDSSLEAKRSGGKSAVWILGGGSPKNFILQTEPQIREILGIEEKGHDYYLQVTDARPDSGGLSGATPGEAVSWGKVDPDSLPDAVVCYLDSTVALPVLTAYSIANHGRRKLKGLYRRLPEMIENLEQEFKRAKRSSEKTLRGARQ
jgi:deoxyhypusine synthase